MICLDFEEIYKSYYIDIYRYLRKLTGDADLSEEIAQETFFRAIKAIESFDGTKDIRAWLFVIARNIYYSHYKRQQNYVYTDWMEETEDKERAFTDTLIDREQILTVQKYLETMEKPYGEVFELRLFGDWSYEKIGRLYGKSSGWARVTYYRAKQKVLKYMEGLEDGKN